MKSFETAIIRSSINTVPFTGVGIVYTSQFMLSILWRETVINIWHLDLK